MDLHARDGPRREGVRGGLEQFRWDSVKGQSLRERECYLGQSVKLGVQGKFGRFSTNDWWVRRRGGPGSEAERERAAVQRFEKELMDEALGLKPKRLSLIKGELSEAQKRELMEEGAAPPAAEPVKLGAPPVKLGASPAQAAPAAAALTQSSAAATAAASRPPTLPRAADLAASREAASQHLVSRDAVSRDAASRPVRARGGAGSPARPSTAAPPSRGSRRGSAGDFARPAAAAAAGDSGGARSSRRSGARVSRSPGRMDRGQPPRAWRSPPRRSRSPVDGRRRRLAEEPGGWRHDPGGWRREPSEARRACTRSRYPRGESNGLQRRARTSPSPRRAYRYTSKGRDGGGGGERDWD